MFSQEINICVEGMATGRRAVTNGGDRRLLPPGQKWQDTFPFSDAWVPPLYSCLKGEHLRAQQLPVVPFIHFHLCQLGCLDTPRDVPCGLQLGPDLCAD